MTTIHAIPAFSDNYIWAIKSARGDVALVDPGDARAAKDWLAQHGGRLTDILITHHHADHVGGVPALADTSVRIHGPADSPFKGITHPLGDQDSITVLGARLFIKAVPGHTLDHIAYLAPAGSWMTEPVLLCGDTLFAAGCGRLFEGTPAMMHQALQWMAALPEATRVYCTHEYTLSNLRFAHAVEPENPVIQKRLHDTQVLRETGMISLPSTIGLERLTNPFLRVNDPAVQSAARTHSQRPLATPIDVLAAIRSWKDTF
ncbi:MAG TPA: hydroxyacylglutathione hydrolase [Pseudomonadales bacterium]